MRIFKTYKQYVKYQKECNRPAMKERVYHSIVIKLKKHFGETLMVSWNYNYNSTVFLLGIVECIIAFHSSLANDELCIAALFT